MAAIVGTPTVGNNGANDTTVASAAKSTTTGNLIAVFVCAQEGAGTNTITGVADTAGNTYTPGTLYGSGGGGALAQWFYAHNITGNASNVVTATFSGNNRYKHIIQVEISGPATSGAFSDESGATNFSGSSISAGDLTLSGDGIFLYGASSTNDRTWTPDGSYTEINDWGTSATAAYDIATASTDNPVATPNAASNNVIAAICFLDASGGGGQAARSMHQFRLRRA